MSKHHKIELEKLAQENLVSGSGCHQVSSAAGHWFFRYIDWIAFLMLNVGMEPLLYGMDPL
tara:strand:- start:5913 stop:6095 length:183 start_codon:yes stop_codon:yes gene_type:complete